ncbi:DUF2312 domain-containing protein [Sinorhizobium fredii]|uniref:GapR-like DNA-binding domain-containing protein n=1 Tax=Rhizobium fredii TaxID=380 RepID=A0A2L0H6I9_RHIFR|nr:GapR family DNA-binding domain-containing protein [Sinorhizobium fredii]AUX76379.1 hypothetical protein NXT3_CH01811 [Sinorhizobium fredii]
MTSDAQIRAFIDRILRLKEEQDTIGEDIRDIYAEAKGMGFDKTAMGNVVAHLRKVSKKGHDTVAEQGAIFDLYLAAYEGNGSHAPAPARTRENIEKFDAETGEILDDNQVPEREQSRGNGSRDHQHVYSRQTDGARHGGQDGVPAGADHAGEAAANAQGLPTSSEIPIDERETDREAADTHAGANAGGPDVDRSAERATAARNEADATVTPASAFTAKPRSALRPNCRNPEACAGYGDRHCHACTVAKRQQEEVA